MRTLLVLFVPASLLAACSDADTSTTGAGAGGGTTTIRDALLEKCAP